MNTQANAPDDVYYESHLARLRKSYVSGTPAQRAGIARQRMDNPGVTANMLITCVSAVEGLSRSLVIEGLVLDGMEHRDAYDTTWRMSPPDMVSAIARSRGQNPETLVDADVCRLFVWGVKYRHLLIHEATFLNENDGSWLIDATRRLFNAIDPS